MTDPIFMHRAIELAQLGRGRVSPNHMVGCVIEHEGKIIGEGFHQVFGGPHAEVQAVASVTNKALLKSSTIYVTLEPCSHFGKTPPCADLLIQHQVKKVVVSNLDPNPLVAGKGLEKLRAAGIEVETGILEEEGEALNRAFFTYHRKKRPFIFLKWAQTTDGFIARENHDSRWISNAQSRQLVHKWRSETDAILIGKNTAIHDNPALTVRDWGGHSPIRILLDSDLSVPESHHLFDEKVLTFIFNMVKSASLKNIEWVQVEALNPPIILKELYERKILSVLIEGGSGVLNSFIQSNFWDEACVFTAPITFKKGILAPKIEGMVTKKEHLIDDTLTYMKNNHG